MSRVAGFVVAIFVLLLSFTTARADNRVALIIGNEAYRHMPTLSNPVRDTTDVATALSDLGFDTIVVTNADLARLNEAIAAFSQKVSRADIALFYFSGHGMQFQGKNYLLPVDADLNTASDVNRFRLLQIDDVIDVLSVAPGMKLLVLDACRTNAAERDFKNRVASVPGGTREAGVTRGFTRIPARSGLIVTYATQSDDVANDGTGLHSPFTAAFLNNIASPNLEVRQMLNRVQSEVFTLTRQMDHPQLPEISSLYVGPDIFLKPSQGAASPQPNDIAPLTLTAVQNTNAAMLPGVSRAPPVSNQMQASINPRQSDFIFPNSDTRLLSSDDVRSLSVEELRIARNEIFARRGRFFNSPDLIARFGRFAWYAPATWNPQLSSIETANVEFLARAEDSQKTAHTESSPRTANDFVFPDSDRRLLTNAEVGRLSKSELRIAKNEIFARRGRYFESADLKSHFGRFSWYSPSTWNPKLSSIEERNVTLLSSFEKR